VLPKGYQLQTGLVSDAAGTLRDRTLLLDFLCLTYSELFPQQKDFSHLTNTVTTYFSTKTPLWWVYSLKQQQKIACLWLGNAIDQADGSSYSHIFLVYVMPDHRRQGLAKALFETANSYARTKGHNRIGLQVYPHNQAALNLYNSLGYHPHSLLMLKSLN
jgi:ribosomal protein S18 acetylase RimI-like enzyme